MRSEKTEQAAALETHTHTRTDPKTRAVPEEPKNVIAIFFFFAILLKPPCWKGRGKKENKMYI